MPPRRWVEARVQKRLCGWYCVLQAVRTVRTLCALMMHSHNHDVLGYVMRGILIFLTYLPFSYPPLLSSNHPPPSYLPSLQPSLPLSRHGHNSQDDPSITQPLIYHQIKSHPATLEIYQVRTYSHPHSHSHSRLYCYLIWVYLMHSAYISIFVAGLLTLSNPSWPSIKITFSSHQVMYSLTILEPISLKLHLIYTYYDQNQLISEGVMTIKECEVRDPCKSCYEMQ